MWIQFCYVSGNAKKILEKCPFAAWKCVRLVLVGREVQIINEILKLVLMVQSIRSDCKGVEGVELFRPGFYFMFFLCFVVFLKHPNPVLRLQKSMVFFSKIGAIEGEFQ